MEILKKWFKENGVKKSFVAKEIGVSSQELNYWINERDFLIPNSIIKLSKITGISLEKFLNNNDEDDFIKIMSKKMVELESTTDFQSIDNFFDKLKAENAAAFDDDIS